MDNKANDFIAKAGECRRLALLTEDALIRHELEDLSKTYRQMARYLEEMCEGSRRLM
jgi:hypothetical protein